MERPEGDAEAAGAALPEDVLAGGQRRRQAGRRVEGVGGHAG